MNAHQKISVWCGMAAEQLLSAERVGKGGGVVVLKLVALKYEKQLSPPTLGGVSTGQVA